MEQLTRRLRFHFRHNLVAYLALFFALGGTAVAAKPLITGADVQDGSLTGADVSEASTLKGVHIDESDLGKVPAAARADNADTLDGKDASELGGPPSSDLRITVTGPDSVTLQPNGPGASARFTHTVVVENLGTDPIRAFPVIQMADNVNAGQQFSDVPPFTVNPRCTFHDQGFPFGRELEFVEIAVCDTRRVLARGDSAIFEVPYQVAAPCDAQFSVGSSARVMFSPFDADAGNDRDEKSTAVQPCPA